MGTLWINQHPDFNPGGVIEATHDPPDRCGLAGAEVESAFEPDRDHIGDRHGSVSDIHEVALGVRVAHLQHEAALAALLRNRDPARKLRRRLAGALPGTDLVEEPQHRHTGPVPAGKVRMYGPGSPGVYLGEADIPYLAPREPVDIKLGAVPDVPVARKLVSATKIDTKSDARDKLVLFNEDDAVELEVKNLRKVPVELLVRDDIAGDWSIVNQSDPFKRVDVDTIEFSVKLEPGETRKVTYTARRYNLQP